MIFIPLPFLYLFNYSLSTLVSINLFDREDDIVLVYGTVISPASIHYSAAMMHLGQDWP